ncbi:hypothetical protein DCCM_2282 [Desulfocucumis palustris]|uniref:HepT-like domain-containing protein n=1 Tax=Desulfocucumis palustris TaxID=1898651 RepID=A0A2L2XBW7_9FIRM|nr:hypothetical protein [Desulfocucumis palustris]GBF33183.1 hypothetical protein DCCM_2282 [Desulfocucumis palustris]
MTRKQFTIIATRLKEELENIRSLCKELSDRGLTGSKKKIKSVLPPGDTFILRAIGSILHDFYVSVENIFETVAREIDESIPTGEHWHRELLLRMVLDIPEVRPPLLSRETAGKLDEFRAFRHVFRNVYGFNLSPDRIVDLVNRLIHTADCLEQEVHTFIQTMKKVMPGE